MELITIRSFKMGDEIYRHAMCLESDAVYLQHYTDNRCATCEDDLWTTLISYDRHCVARLADGTKIGDFRNEGGPNHWVFYESPNRTRINFGRINGAEALLETELLYSRRWLIARELRVAMTRRLAELSAEKTTVPAGTAKVAPQ